MGKLKIWWKRIKWPLVRRKTFDLVETQEELLRSEVRLLRQELRNEALNSRLQLQTLERVAREEKENLDERVAGFPLVDEAFLPATSPPNPT